MIWTFLFIGGILLFAIFVLRRDVSKTKKRLEQEQKQVKSTKNPTIRTSNMHRNDTSTPLQSITLDMIDEIDNRFEPEVFKTTNNFTSSSYSSSSRSRSEEDFSASSYDSSNSSSSDSGSSSFD